MESIKQGSIGKVRLMNSQKSYKLGSRSEFYKHRQTYGGTIPWVGSHAIDWMYWLSGRDLLVSMLLILGSIIGIMEI
jgi:predicted dehydrogenase